MTIQSDLSEKLVSQNRWSLEMGSIVVKYRSSQLKTGLSTQVVSDDSVLSRQSSLYYISIIAVLNATHQILINKL